MALKIALVGSTDRQIDEFLRAAGMKVVALELGALPALAAPTTPQPDVIVLDLRTENRIPAALPAVRRQHPGTGIVLIAATLDPEILLPAMRAGVNEVVSNPVTQTDLEQAITRVVQQRQSHDMGKVFGFVGAKGGVGTTTVTVNVASALGLATRSRTLVMDLHQAGGDAAVFLGVEPRFSIADAIENTHRLDRMFFHGLVAQAGGEVDLLPSPERAFAGPADSSKIRAIIDFASSTYKYTLLDLPRSDATVLDALDSLHTIVVVVNQELATVKGAGRLVSTLRQRYGREKVQVVVSRSDRQADIGHADVERALGGSIAFTFPSDYRNALLALNKGRPVASDNHNELSGAFRRFALQLAGLKTEHAARTGLLGRLTSRKT